MHTTIIKRSRKITSITKITNIITTMNNTQNSFAVEDGIKTNIQTPCTPLQTRV